jgi:hypothetical protein
MTRVDVESAQYGRFHLKELSVGESVKTIKVLT